MSVSLLGERNALALLKLVEKWVAEDEAMIADFAAAAAAAAAAVVEKDAAIAIAPNNSATAVDIFPMEEQT